MRRLRVRGFAARLGIACAIAFIGVFIIGLAGVSKAPSTPFDEAAHLDYLFKIADGHMPAVGEVYGQKILSIMACDNPRGAAWAGVEPCGSAHFDPARAPFSGESSATSNAPTYYVLSAIPFRLCTFATDLNPRTCGRAANVVWLSAAAAAQETLAGSRNLR